MCIRDRTKFKDIDVLELWNKFDTVSIGASLDAEGARGELMRKGKNGTMSLPTERECWKFAHRLIFISVPQLD